MVLHLFLKLISHFFLHYLEKQSTYYIQDKVSIIFLKRSQQQNSEAVDYKMEEQIQSQLQFNSLIQHHHIIKSTLPRICIKIENALPRNESLLSYTRNPVSISRSKEMHHCPPAVGIQFQFLGCLHKRRMKMGGSSLAGASPDGSANFIPELG